MELALFAAVLLVTSVSADAASQSVGAAAYRGNDPIGGGPGYTRIVKKSEAAYVVDDLAGLKAALAKAKPGEVIYIADGAEIDASGEREIVIPGGVTLAGCRGRGGSAGPVIRASVLEIEPTEEEKASMAASGRSSFYWRLFIIGGPDVRITGIRIQGPDTTIRESAYVAPTCDAISCGFPNLEVDNCEIWGWAHAAVMLRDPCRGARIHHCDIHHCRRMGLGYGVCLAAAQALIEANRFADNRHDIAGTGRAGTSYVARYNISEANDPPISHAFDMHGNHESRRPDEIVPHFAGDMIVICFNTFKSREPRDGIRIRGEPRLGVLVHHNVYENARIGADFASPCRNAVIYGDAFCSTPAIAFYRFRENGNIVNGKRAPAGEVKALP